MTTLMLIYGALGLATAALAVWLVIHEGHRK